MSPELANLFFMLGGLLLCALGAAFCFAGYRLARFILVLLGFIVGAALTAAICHAFFGLDTWISLAAGMLGGVLGAVLLAFFYAVGVFVIGVGFGISLTTLLPPSVPIEPRISMVVLGLAGGVLAFLGQKFLVIAGSAALGSWAMILGAYAVLGMIDITEVSRDPLPATYLLAQQNWLKFLWLGLSLAGIAVQFRRRDSQRREDESD